MFILRRILESSSYITITLMLCCCYENRLHVTVNQYKDKETDTNMKNNRERNKELSKLEMEQTTTQNNK